MIFPKLQWTSRGKIIKCCEKHAKVAVPYGQCSTHVSFEKIFGKSAKSFGALCIHNVKKCLVVAVFYNHWWHGTSLTSLLNNQEMFICIPLDDVAFLSNKLIPSYKIHKQEIATSFHELTFLFPREVYEMYLVNWNIRDQAEKVKFFFFF